MANRKDFEKKSTRRTVRYFSESFKKQKVKEIERNLTTVNEVHKEYAVSCTSVYKWLDKYSLYNKHQVRQIVEPMSDSRKIKELQKRIKDLEQLLGQKQFLIEFREKQIEIAEEMFQIDIKKKPISGPSSGTGSTKNKSTGA